MNNRQFNIILQALVEGVKSKKFFKLSEEDEEQKEDEEQDEEPQQPENSDEPEQPKSPELSPTQSSKFYKIGAEDFTIAKTGRATAIYDRYGISGEIKKSRDALLYLQAILSAMKNSVGSTNTIVEEIETGVKDPLTTIGFETAKNVLNTRPKTYLKFEDDLKPNDFNLINIIKDQSGVIKKNPNYIKKLEDAGTSVKSEFKKKGDEGIKNLEVIDKYFQSLLNSKFAGELIKILTEIYKEIEKEGEPTEKPEAPEEPSNKDPMDNLSDENKALVKERLEVYSDANAIVSHYYKTKFKLAKEDSKFGKRLMDKINSTIGSMTPRKNLDKYNKDFNYGDKIILNPIGETFIASNVKSVMNTEKLKNAVNEIFKSLSNTKQNVDIASKIKAKSQIFSENVAKKIIFKELFNIDIDSKTEDKED